MNVRDYSNYHNTNMNGKITHDGLLILEQSLNGFEGNDVLINNLTTSRVLLYQKYEADGSQKRVIGRIEDIEIGNLFKIDNQNWIVTTLPEDNKIYRKATIQLCNYTLQLKGDEIRRTLIGYNRFNEPQYEIVYNTLFIPCVIKNTADSFNSTDLDQPINLPNGKLRIIITYNEAHKVVKENDEFTIYNRKYKVVGLDFSSVFNEKGIITLNMERVVKD